MRGNKSYKVVLKDEDLVIQAPDDEAAAQVALTLSDHLEQDLMDVIPMKNNKDFPNKWKEWKNLPAEMLEPMPVEDVLVHRVGQWELKPGVFLVLRTYHLETGKVQEKVYKTERGLVNAIKRLALDGKHELVMVDDVSVGTFNPLHHAIDIDELL